MPNPDRKLLSAVAAFKIISLDFYGYASFSQYYEGPNTIVFENICIAEDLKIINTTKGFSLKFTNCELGNISFIRNTYAFGLTLTNTKVENLIFDNTNTTSITVNSDSEICNCLNILSSAMPSFSIECSVKKLIIQGPVNAWVNLKFNQNIDSVTIQDISNIKMLVCGEIITCLIKNSHYPFQSSVVINKLMIERSVTADNIISGCFKNIEIKNAVYPFSFTNVICCENIVVKNDIGSEPSIPMPLENVYIGGTLLIDNVLRDIVFTLNTDKGRYILINNLEILTAIRSLSLRNSEEDTYFHINSIVFKNFTFSKDSIWKLEKLHCSNILFYNFRNFGTGNIDNTSGGYFRPLKIAFDELVDLLKPFNGNYTEFLADQKNINYNLNIDRVLTFRQSDFGRLNFINTDFSDFKLYFYSTKLNEIFLAGSRMPKTVEALKIEDSDSFHQQRLANTQLKKLHELHGDVVAANEYFANEMNSYYSSLKWKSHFWEKLQLWLNKVSSNHAQSWKRALGSTLLVSVLLYCLFCLTINYTMANPFKLENWKVLWNLQSYYWEFLSPLHKLDNFNGLVPENKIPPLTRTIDSLSRIVNSYFIYQLIQAFRKHSRAK